MLISSSTENSNYFLGRYQFNCLYHIRYFNSLCTSVWIEWWKHEKKTVKLSSFMQFRNQTHGDQFVHNYDLKFRNRFYNVAWNNHPKFYSLSIESILTCLTTNRQNPRPMYPRPLPDAPSRKGLYLVLVIPGPNDHHSISQSALSRSYIYFPFQFLLICTLL